LLANAAALPPVSAHALPPLYWHVGYYFDPLSSPFQKLKLKPTSSTANGLGQTFPAFAFR